MVIDLDSVADEGWRLLEGLAQIPRQVFPVVIGSSEIDDLEWLARELGAVDFVENTIGGDALAAICRRLLIHQAV